MYSEMPPLADADKQAWSVKLEEDTASFLWRGGVIQRIAFGKTTTGRHPDVAEYAHIHRRGYYMSDIFSLTTTGREDDLARYTTLISENYYD